MKLIEVGETNIANIYTSNTDEFPRTPDFFLNTDANNLEMLVYVDRTVNTVLFIPNSTNVYKFASKLKTEESRKDGISENGLIKVIKLLTDKK